MKYIIAGLGNPGAEYEHTRHNIGFDILDYMAKEYKVEFSNSRFAFKTEFRYKGEIIILIKPSTFMNLSGKAIKYWIDKENLPYHNLMVILDDINLPPGKIRIRNHGSDGGHNGLKNIQEILHTTQYPRLRFGIGNEFSKGRQVDFVLSTWENNEIKIIEEKIKEASKAVLSFILEGIDVAMNKYN